MGKSMVLRKVAAGRKKELRLFGSHLHVFSAFDWRDSGGYRQRAAVDPLQFTFRRQFAQIATNGVF